MVLSGSEKASRQAGSERNSCSGELPGWVGDPDGLDALLCIALLVWSGVLCCGLFPHLPTHSVTLLISVAFFPLSLLLLFVARIRGNFAFFVYPWDLTTHTTPPPSLSLLLPEQLPDLEIFMF